MGKPVVHFEIASANSTEAQTFYSKLFGWEINANNPMKYGIVKTAKGVGINGGLFQADAGKEAVVVYVAVEDTDAYLKKVVSMGGTVIHPTEVIPGMVTFALFADPFGTVMGLIKDVPPPKPAPAIAAGKKANPAAKTKAVKKAAPKKKAKKAAKKPAAKKKRK
ncbi:MAG TPA: VOC family protein [Leptospiraceae bacterium]|nr:VOC family protein [Leptospiraceae bacterium]